MRGMRTYERINLFKTDGAVQAMEIGRGGGHGQDGTEQREQKGANEKKEEEKCSHHTIVQLKTEAEGLDKHHKVLPCKFFCLERNVFAGRCTLDFLSTQ